MAGIVTPPPSAPAATVVLINDPSKDSYLVNLSMTGPQAVMIQMGTSLFEGQTIHIVIKQNGAGNGIVQFDSNSVLFPDGAQPVLSMDSDGYLVISGVIIYGYLRAQVVTMPTYLPITGHEQGVIAPSWGMSYVGFQPYNLVTKISVTDSSKAPIFRLDTPIAQDPYASAASMAVGFSLQTDNVTSLSQSGDVMGWVTFAPGMNTGVLFVNPFAQVVTLNAVGAGIPIGLHGTTDYNAVIVALPTSTPPAYVIQFNATSIPIMTSTPTGLDLSTMYPLNITIEDANQVLVSTISITVAGQATMGQLVTAINNALSAAATNIQCAWSFGNSLAFVYGDNPNYQQASYISINLADSGSVFSAMSDFYWSSFNTVLYGVATNVSASGPQPSDMYATNTDAAAGGLRWFIPTVHSKPMQMPALF